MIKKIRISKIFLSIFLFISIVNAEELDLNLKSERYILYNLDNDSIIVEKDAYSKTNVASLTKIMSTIVSIENAKDYNSDITITSDMISGIAADVAKVGLKKGQKVKYDDLIAGSLISSGADAIQALSIYSNGTLKNTIGLMNTKVSELGLKNSNFTNVVGLYDKYNYSSAYDMAQILKYALKNDRFKKIFTSNIIKHKEENVIKSWFNTNILSAELIYDTTRDGDSIEDFKNKCFGQFPTLVIIRTDMGFMFGGYATTAWKENGPITDYNSFVFSFNPDKKYNVLMPRFALFGSNAKEKVLFQFGSLCFRIEDNCTKTGNNVIRGSGYEKGLIDLIKGDHKFRVSRLEVFKINF